MRGFNLVGLLFIVMGFFLAATADFSFEEKKKLLAPQNVDIPLKDHHTSNWPWLAGTIAVASGIAIFLLRSKKR